MNVFEGITCCVLALVTFAVFRKEFLKVKDVFVDFWIPSKRRKARDDKRKRQESNKENVAPTYNMPSEATIRTSSPLKTVENGTITKEIVTSTETTTKVTEEKEGIRIKSATLLPDVISNSNNESTFKNFTSQKLNEEVDHKERTTDNKPVDSFPLFSELMQTTQGPPKPPRCPPVDSSTFSKIEEFKNEDDGFTKTVTETKHEKTGNTEVSFTKKDEESVCKSVAEEDPMVSLDSLDLNDLISATQKRLDSFKTGVQSEDSMLHQSSVYEVKKTETKTSTSVTESKCTDAFSNLGQTPFSSYFDSTIADSMGRPKQTETTSSASTAKDAFGPLGQSPFASIFDSTTNDTMGHLKKDLESLSGLGFTSDESSFVSTETPFGSSSVMKKKKMFSSSSFYEEPGSLYPTLEEQVEMARKIADSLADDTNKKSKGANMFDKRVKRSSKWIHEGPEPSDESGCGTPEIQGSAPDFSHVLFQPARGPSNLKLVLDPRHTLDATALRSSGLSISEHNVVSPEVCYGLVKDLHSPVGKGAALFAKRKKKSEEWVVDEEKVKTLLREQEKKSKLPQTPSYNQYSTFSRQDVKLVKSPWEAAMESPYGYCDSAFARVNPGELANTVIRAADEKRRNSNTPLSRESSRMEGCMSPPPLPMTPAGAQFDIYHAKAPKGWTACGTPGQLSIAQTSYPSMPRNNVQQGSTNGFQTPQKMTFQNFNTLPRQWKGFSAH